MSGCVTDLSEVIHVGDGLCTVGLVYIKLFFLKKFGFIAQSEEHGYN